MKTTGWTVLGYALLVFLGGIFGYVKAGSTPSLVMGVIFAVILSTSAFAMFNEKKIGLFAAIVATAILAAFFLYRFAAAFHFMPAGLMSVLSLIILAFLLVKRTQLGTSNSKPET